MELCCISATDVVWSLWQLVYFVQGHVLSDGEPVHGVNFVLFYPKTSSSLVRMPQFHNR